MALSRCLGSVALLLTGAEGSRIARKREKQHRQSRSLCDEVTVLDTCAQLGGAEGSVESSRIADALGVSQVEATGFLEQLGIYDEVVSCEALCRYTVKSFPKDRIPPSEDLGCYMSEGGKVCDVDLTDEKLAAMAHENVVNRVKRNEPRIKKDILSADDAEAMASALVSLNHQVSEDMQVSMANWFHIYPMTGGDLDAASIGGAHNQRELDAQTKAQLVKTIQQLNQGNIDGKVQEWFGSADASTKRLVRQGLLHIQNVMKAPHYINHPDERGYYGWVYSPYTQASNGTWPIHLGGAYFNARSSSQIGTLTHEASHFYPLGTWDHMYCDVIGCKTMAKREPSKAQENADHFSFFIDDVVGGGMGEEY